MHPKLCKLKKNQPRLSVTATEGTNDSRLSPVKSLIIQWRMHVGEVISHYHHWFILHALDFVKFQEMLHEYT